jgi:2,3,4,5-tetrahydropyridine-2-carboxylate N-succinyltransferase
MSKTLFAVGFGVGTRNQKGDWLEVFYPAPLINPAAGVIAALEAIGYGEGNSAIDLDQSKLGALESALRKAGEITQADVVQALKDSTQPRVAVIPPAMCSRSQLRRLI